MVRPFALGVLSVIGSATVMSETLPVRSPLGSPLARAFGSGAAMPVLRSVLVIGTLAGGAAAAGAAAGGVAGGGCCASNNKGAALKTSINPTNRVAFLFFIEFI